MTAADAASERCSRVWRRERAAELAREAAEGSAMSAEEQSQRDAAAARVLAEEADMREAEQRARERERMRAEDAAATQREAQDAAEARFKTVVYTDFQPYFPGNEERFLLSPEPATPPRESPWRRGARAATEEALSRSPVPRLVDCEDSERLQRLMGVRRGTRKRIHVGGPRARTAGATKRSLDPMPPTPASAFDDSFALPSMASQSGVSADPIRRRGDQSAVGEGPALGPARRRGVRDQAASALARASLRSPALARTGSWLAASADDIRAPLRASAVAGAGEVAGAGPQEGMGGRVEHSAVEAAPRHTPARRTGAKARLPTSPGSRSPGGAAERLVGSPSSPPLRLDTQAGPSSAGDDGHWAITGPVFAPKTTTTPQRADQATPGTAAATAASASNRQAASAPDARLQLTTGVPFSRSATMGHVVGGRAAPLLKRPARRHMGGAFP